MDVMPARIDKLITRIVEHDLDYDDLHALLSLLRAVQAKSWQHELTLADKLVVQASTACLERGMDLRPINHPERNGE
jgi:hypothetical protein